MRLGYLLNDSEYSLSSFFSEDFLSAIMTCVYLVGACMVCFWPGFTFSRFIFLKTTPLIFPVILIFSLIYVSYLNLSCGAGDFFKKNKFGLKTKKDAAQTFEVAIYLFAYVLPAFATHTVLIYLILLPFYIISSAVSGISMTVLAICLGVLLISSVISRFLGYFSYLVCGSLSLTGFLLSRMLFTLYFFLSGYINPVFNPIYIIYQVYRKEKFDSFIYTDSQGHLIFASFFLGVLILLCLVVIVKKKTKRVQ